MTSVRRSATTKKTWMETQQLDCEYAGVNTPTQSEIDKGQYLGAPCETSCHAKLLHVYCNPASGKCECEKNYPVKLNPYTGCGKPKRLGDQCYYRETCQYTDQHSACIQIHHNAICQCKDGYHSVSIQKPSKRVFCAEDLVVMTTDFSAFAGVLSGIAILSGLICFVLRLFNQNMYGPRRHRFGNANLAPPILFSSDPVKTWCGVSPRTFDKITLATINRLSKVFYINVVKTVLDDGASKEIASYSKFLTSSKGS
ncbi:hypothetical protein GEV33_000769 [Tenebrio molitor]|uniref:EB domain-containing protein n=1 Tax=Tenebrio molitor TaxID=7067 RepID=A0A8J6LKM7_TENMO|nr:hypothetical protein GEV33_000769 [Tenebrio molitor]